jgi:ribosomal RNA-processing protein 36
MNKCNKEESMLQRLPRTNFIMKDDGPVEMSSKKPISRYRTIVSTKKQSRDPRFLPKVGHFNPSVFNQSYGFINELQDSELTHLEKEKLKTKNKEMSESMEKLIQTMKSRKEARLNASKAQEIKRSWKKEEMQKVSQGKKPFYLKKNELKKMELIQKYKSLKDSGEKAVDRYLEKKRKKKASKEKLGMPKTRRL